MTRRFAAGVLALWLPALAAAQGTVPIQLPKALVFPNYDNVLFGKDQALEGGAYIARAGDASANFYNPAGLVLSEKTSLNASSTGWVRTKLTSQALGTSVTSSKIDNVPGYLGAVIEPPYINSRNIRIGLSLTRLVAWSPGGLDITSTNTGVDQLNRITYSATSNFTTQLYQAAVAWAPVEDRSLRLGASFGLANTSYFSSGTLSGGVTDSTGNPGQFVSTLRANGNEWDMVFGVGVQWDVLAGLTVGATIRSPGIKLTSSAVVTYESSQLASVSTQQTNATFLHDESGQFEYKLPAEVGIGIAYRFPNGQVEADLRYHDAVSRYDFYRPSAPLLVTSQTGSTTTQSTQPLAPITYAARRVFNGSIGANYKLGRVATLHGGFYTALSPVDDPVNSPLRQADLYGITAGVDFQFEHFGLSIGAGYQFGSAPSTPISVAGQTAQGSGVDLQSISILYAVSYQF